MAGPIGTTPAGAALTTAPAAEAPVTARPDTVPFRSWVAVVGAVLGAFMAVMNIHVTNASLADIEGAIGATADEGSWVSTSYLVAEIIVIPLTAWLAQVFSTRRFLLGCTALFLCFSVACSFATSLGAMIALRALQGGFGGVLIPMAFQIILTELPPGRRPTGIALFALSSTFAPAVGPAIGGWLTDTYSWHWIFYLQLVPGALLLAAVSWAVAPKPMNLGLLRHGDWAGIAAMAVGLGALQVVLEEGNRKDWFGSPYIVHMALVGGVALAAFVAIEIRRARPFIDLRLLLRYNFGLSSLVNLVFGAALFGLAYLVAEYLAQVQRYSATQIGTTVVWYGLPQLLLIPLTPRLMKRFDLRLMIAFGMALMAASCFMVTGLTADSARNQVIPSLVVRALGQPFVMVPLSQVATAGIGPAQAGSASGLFNMLRNLGGAVGTAVLGWLLSVRERFHSERVGEAVTAFAPATRERVIEGTQHFLGLHLDRAHAWYGADAGYFRMQALAAIDASVRREAFLMAYADVFLVVGLLLVLGVGLVFALRKISLSALGGGGSAH